MRRAEIVDAVTTATLDLLRTRGAAPRKLVEPSLPERVQLREKLALETWRDVKRDGHRAKSPT